MDINQKITEELGVKLWQVEAAVKLIDEGTQFHLLPDIEKKQPERWMMNSSVNYMKDSFTCAIWKKRKNRY